MTTTPKAIDLFAGAGGFTQGATAAGLDVVWAANHWAAAVQVHASNHPGTSHVCQDLHQADWSAVPSHDVLLASPCCQGHSRARGVERPQHDASRATAWAVVSAAEFHRPEVLIVENVREFQGWSLFPAWKLALETLGYTLTPHILDAADFGVAQHRVRLFLVGSKSKAGLKLSLPRGGHIPSSSIIDWDNGAQWSKVDKSGRSAKTLARVERGRGEFGDQFVMSYYGNSKTGRSLDRPLGTVTTRDRWAIVDGPRMRMLTVDEYKHAMGFPASYDVPQTPKRLGIHLLGNAVCPPVAQAVIEEIQRAA